MTSPALPPRWARTKSSISARVQISPNRCLRYSSARDLIEGVRGATRYAPLRLAVCPGKKDIVLVQRLFPAGAHCSTRAKAKRSISSSLT